MISSVAVQSKHGSVTLMPCTLELLLAHAPATSRREQIRVEMRAEFACYTLASPSQ